MSDSFWEDVGQELFNAVADIALAAGINDVFGGSKKSDSSQLVAVQEPVGAALIWVGGWARAAGDKVFHETQPDNISRFWTVQALADHRLEFGDIYLNSDIALFDDGDGWVTDVQKVENRDGRYNDNKVRILWREGLPTETTYEYPNNLGGDHDSDLISSFPDMLDDSFRGDGTASVMMLTILPTKGFRAQAFPNSHPELSVRGRNKAIYDWRDGTQDRDDEATWKPCHNPVVNWVHLEWYRWGRDWNRCIAPVLAALTVEADYCDEEVALNGGGTEPRYEVAFTYRADEDQDSVRQRLKASMDGFFTTDGLGRLIIRAGRYDAPTLTIPADFIADYDWDQGFDEGTRVDRLEINFTNSAALYNTDQCDPWQITESSRRPETLDLTMVTSWTQARRLAKRKAAQVMPAYRGKIPVGHWGIHWFLSGCPRYIMAENPEEPSMNMVPLEVLEVEDDPLGTGFTFTVATADPNIDDWAPATEEGNAPADPQLT